MQELIDKVQELVTFEVERANTIHPPQFNSMHEAYAVILEEYEEAEEAFKRAEWDKDRAWDNIKHDKDPDGFLKDTEEAAIAASAEMIQVAAMCRKARK